MNQFRSRYYRSEPAINLYQDLDLYKILVAAKIRTIKVIINDGFYGWIALSALACRSQWLSTYTDTVVMKQTLSTILCLFNSILLVVNNSSIDNYCPSRKLSLTPIGRRI
jgi:hypothetical protein